MKNPVKLGTTGLGLNSLSAAMAQALAWRERSGRESLLSKDDSREIAVYSEKDIPWHIKANGFHVCVFFELLPCKWDDPLVEYPGDDKPSVQQVAEEKLARTNWDKMENSSEPRD